MSRRRTNEEFVKDISKLNPKYDILTSYVNLKTKVKCVCHVCKHEWLANPRDLLVGKSCPQCAIKKSVDSKRKTNDAFLSELAKMNPNITPLEPYAGALTKIHVRCKICKNEWNVEPHSLLQGKGCNVCSSARAGLKSRKSHTKFIKEMTQKHPELIVNGTYVDSWTSISCTCVNCNRTFNVKPADILSRKGCPKCNIDNLPQRQAKPFQQFVSELKSINPDIIVLGGYTKASERVDVKCNICGHQWSPIGTSLTSGFGCPRCAQSRGEKVISQFLKDNSVAFIPQQTFSGLVGVGGRLLSYDFYLPEYNLLIEYQGEYHDGTAGNQTTEEFIRQQEHDKRKKKYADKHNIQLLTIWYYEQDKMIEILNNTLYNPVTTKAI